MVENELHGGHLENPEEDFTITGIYNDKGKFYKDIAALLDKSQFIDYKIDYNIYNPNIQYGLHRNGHGIILSFINNIPKYSSDFFNCTSLIVMAKNEDGKNISFMSHLDPAFFLSEEKAENIETYGFGDNLSKKELSRKLLIKTLEDLKNQSISQTIDIVILGGNSNDFYTEYFKSIEFIEKICKEIFLINPVIVGGPSNNSNDKFQYKDILVNTKERKIYLLKLSKFEDNINAISYEIKEVLNKKKV